MSSTISPKDPPPDPPEDQTPQQQEQQEQIQIGHPPNFWLYNPPTQTFNLTHPSHPTSPPLPPSKILHLNTTTSPILIDPSKSALLIIDMQNFFLSPLLPPYSTTGAGHVAAKNLAEVGIPAFREAGVQVVWLNWGLTEEDLGEMPAGAVRAFGGFGKGRGKRGDGEGGEGAEGKGRGKYVGMGNPLGLLKDPLTGEQIDAGKMLMRDQWNTALYPPSLAAHYTAGLTLPKRPDIWIHKNRMSGLWGTPQNNSCETFLRENGITTLFFAGVNTDQCVGGTMQDAWSKGFDCILLKDGTGTSSPDFAQACWEWNSEGGLGFVVDCEGVREGVEGMKRAAK